MPQFMLDTNICIYLMKNQPPVVAERLDRCYIGDVVISAITFAEFEYGALTSLVTNNIKDFAAYPGVRLENWLDERVRC